VRVLVHVHFDISSGRPFAHLRALKGRGLPAPTVRPSTIPREPRSGTLTPIRDYSLVEGVTSAPRSDTLTRMRDYL
jgi:hypothetical protein